MEREKLCWFCSNFLYENMVPDWSDVTPGDPFALYCRKNHWQFSAKKTTQMQFAQILSTAKECPDFVWIEGLK